MVTALRSLAFCKTVKLIRLGEDVRVEVESLQRREECLKKEMGEMEVERQRLRHRMKSC